MVKECWIKLKKKPLENIFALKVFTENLAFNFLVVQWCQSIYVADSTSWSKACWFRFYHILYLNGLIKLLDIHASI